MRYLPSAIDAFTRLVLPCRRRIQVSDADHRKAVLLLDGWHTALRAGDGLHLAIAGARRATIFTFDQGMANAGATLGIAVRLLRKHGCCASDCRGVDQTRLGQGRLGAFSEGVIADAVIQFRRPERRARIGSRDTSR